jgi:hypothetical protein
MSHAITDTEARLLEREAQAFANRDEAEARVTEIIGWSLNGLQFYQLRLALADFERNEERIGKIQELMNKVIEERSV